jgi:lysophospholipase L1-like esterase
MEGPKTATKLSTAKKLCFSVISSVLLVLLLEGFLRVIGFSFQHAGLQSSTEWGVGQDTALSWSWMPVPGATCNLSKWGFSFKFNAMGYRGPMFEKQKLPDTIRIVCMGDSVTMGWRVEDDRTFCSNLQRILAPQFKKKVETINAGVMAYTSYQGLHQLQARVLDLKPDLIVLSYNWDDHSPATTVSEVFGSKDSRELKIMPDKDLPNVTSKGGPLGYLSYLRTFQLVQLGVSKILPAAEPEKLGVSRPRKTEEGVVRVPLQDYRDNMERMVEIAQTNHIIPILLTEPCGAETHQKVDLSSDAVIRKQPLLNAQYNAAVKEIASRRGVACVDTVPVFQAEQPSFLDSIHPGNRGHLLIAQELSRAILALNIEDLK